MAEGYGSAGVPPALDLELLRTFQAAVRYGSLAAAAQMRHRTLSAVSMQLKRLESALGVKLLERGPRGVVPTASGDVLLHEARELLRLHDGLLGRFSGDDVQGQVTLGIPEDYARELLDETLPLFMSRYPGVLLDVVTDTSGQLARRLQRRKLDVAVILDRPAGLSEGQNLWRTTPVWAAPQRGELHRQAILPLAIHPLECPYRALAIDALDGAQRRWRTTFTSTSIHAVEKAIEMGMAIGVLDRERVTSAMRELGEADGMPVLRTCEARLHLAEDIAVASQSAVEALAQLLRDQLFGRGPWQASRLSSGRA